MNKLFINAIIFLWVIYHSAYKAPVEESVTDLCIVGVQPACCLCEMFGNSRHILPKVQDSGPVQSMIPKGLLLSTGLWRMRNL